VQVKIQNQAYLLDKMSGAVVKNMNAWAADVKSGDPDNYEARAAVYYWANLFPGIQGFSRNRDGVPPNNLLNYGYAVLRAVVARSLVAMACFRHWAFIIATNTMPIAWLLM
jgi:CRISPR-associated protein Cas1